MDITLAKQRYIEQKKRAKQRNIDWYFTFEEWCEVWNQSGKWHQRGVGRNTYVMARIGDVGPYSTENVKIILNADNIREAAPAISRARKGQPAPNKGIAHNSNAKAKMAYRAQNRQKLECPHCFKIVDASNAKRWHFNRCKNIKSTIYDK